MKFKEVVGESRLQSPHQGKGACHVMNASIPSRHLKILTFLKPMMVSKISIVSLVNCVPNRQNRIANSWSISTLRLLSRAFLFYLLKIDLAPTRKQSARQNIHCKLTSPQSISLLTTNPHHDCCEAWSLRWPYILARCRGSSPERRHTTFASAKRLPSAGQRSRDRGWDLAVLFSLSKYLNRSDTSSDQPLDIPAVYEFESFKSFPRRDMAAVTLFQQRHEAKRINLEFRFSRSKSKESFSSLLQSLWAEILTLEFDLQIDENTSPSPPRNQLLVESVILVVENVTVTERWSCRCSWQLENWLHAPYL
jgi:hypothetical protein